MPAEIIAQTCPAPECSLLPGDVEQFIEELAAFFDLKGATADEIIEVLNARVEECPGASARGRWASSLGMKIVAC